MDIFWNSDSLGANTNLLSNVKVVRDELLGTGSYTAVIELEYLGMKCAGKKIHDWLLRDQGSARSTDTIRRFGEECRLLSQVRHPNIVQFLGVYFQQGVRAPILVVEFLPTNLTSCIEQYGILPKEISYSILHDVSLGLCYLHSQTPVIIHRDLSSNNILLTPNMTAKISDLGVAKILEHIPVQVRRMTPTPGTPAYMPPEAMMADPKYDTCIDEFSYGIVMIHVFSGQLPEPQIGFIRIDHDGTMIPVSEAERREEFLQAIGDDHPLMDLIRKCIHNDPQARPHASEIVKQLAKMILQFPTSFANRLEMLTEINHLKTSHSLEVEMVQPQTSNLHKQSQLLEDEQVKAETQNEIQQGIFHKVPRQSELVLLKYTHHGERRKVRIISEASHRWKDIAELILQDYLIVGTIEEQCHSDPIDCLRQTFMEGFIKNKPKWYSQDWRGLIDLLQDASLEDLASRVEHACSHL